MSSVSLSAEPASVALRRAWKAYSQKITASLEVKRQQGHLLVLDGVRAIACLAVVFHHAFYHVVLAAGIWHPAGKLQVGLAALVLRCLAKKAEERPATRVLHAELVALALAGN